MAIRKRLAVETALLQKGFSLDTSSSGDHRYYVFYIEDRLVARTKVSHGTKYKDLADDLLMHMSKQCHLTKGEFLDLVDCHISQIEYEIILAERNKF
jgi:hypothetical protein